MNDSLKCWSGDGIGDQLAGRAAGVIRLIFIIRGADRLNLSNMLSLFQSLRLIRPGVIDSSSVLFLFEMT